MAGLVLVNPGSGPRETQVDDLRDAFPDDEVRACDPREIATEVEKAVAAGVSFIGIAGGDGTMRCAASVLAGTDVPLLPIPAGTRNHFARDLGLETIDAAVAAGRAGRTRRVDTGIVNGEVFVNNASFGLYPRFVRTREAHESRVPKKIAQVFALVHQVRNGRPVHATIDGQARRAWLVFVGNGVYGEGFHDLVGRDALDRGELDLCIVRAHRKFARTRTVLSALVGRLSRSTAVERSTTSSCDVVLPATSIDVALDGEVVNLATPLAFESAPGALVVLAP
jgi:diacylglycerol kinase family enzyme